MTMDELKKMCVETRKQGLEKLYLMVNVKKAPRSEAIRVTGFGNGYVVSVQQCEDGSFNCTCYFRLTTVEKNILRWEAGQKLK